MSTTTLKLQEVPLSQIKGPAFKLRIETQELDPDLVESIRNHGIKQPILLRPNKPPFEIVAGLQRFSASKHLRLKSIPAVTRQNLSRERKDSAKYRNIRLSMGTYGRLDNNNNCSSVDAI